MADVQKLLIVGGVAGGASAAARARRLNEAAQIIVFERGPYVSFANCGLPYHLGGDIAERESLLLHTPESLTARFGLDVRVNSEVLSIDRSNKTVRVLNRLTGDEYLESYDALILAPGAAPIRPPLPGLDHERVFTLRTVPDLDRLMNVMTPDVKHVTVVGAGFIGLETVEALRHRGLQASLVERGTQVLTPLDAEMTAPLSHELKAHGVELLLGESLQSVNAGERLTLQMESGRQVTTDLVVLAIGVKPENQLAREAGLEIGSTGGVYVNEQQQTSDSSIYAVGDAVEVRHTINGKAVLLPLAGPANRQGRIAADTIFGRQAHYRGSQGTAICKVFDHTAASTGLNEKTLQAANMPYQKLYLHGNDHASYYPGATMISLKVLFDPASGKLLGAQAVGEKGVDKRIDVLAVALQAGMTIDDLAEMELSYAPPYGAAKDPVNLAGMAAQNWQAGLLQLTQPEDLAQASDAQIIDVREPEEIASGQIAGARNLPLSQLRQLSHLLDKNKPVIVYCMVGLRGYIAQRHLSQLGFNVRSLNGGYKTWQMWQATKTA
ncbi:FAD-dependent oxidoreductase [Chitinibacter bivalviorum]|uniref:FAD-dependent oxidoreductase n=1 Tax=Chitinibacter bivalviorum TaxID=2739434 RepID=A0A7H9BKD0_9NEIS|nr:FAD-dependent oxidoreductase [Chitinibacter bivalviorum]QLG88822.1 FAD-dependent oxidoreductase [Chitinibacter bivalviorum]